MHSIPSSFKEKLRGMTAIFSLVAENGLSRYRGYALRHVNIVYLIDGWRLITLPIISARPVDVKGPDSSQDWLLADVLCSAVAASASFGSPGETATIKDEACYGFLVRGGSLFPSRLREI